MGDDDSRKLEILNSQHSLQALQQVVCPYQAAQVVWAPSKHLSRSLSLPGTPPIWECLYKCLGKEELQCLVSVKNFLKDWVVYFLSLKESPLGASLILRSFSQRVKWITLKEIATQQAPSHFPLLSSFFNTVTWLVLNSQKFVSLLFLSAGMKYMCCHVWPST